MRRIVVLVVGSAVVSVTLVGRVGWLDVVHGDRLHQVSLDQRMRRVPIAAPRGTLYDRTGRVLAVSATADSVYAVPAEVRHPAREAAVLARLLGVGAAGVKARLTRSVGFVWISRRVDARAATAVRRLALAGIGIAAESRRLYPYGPLAGEVIGFSGVDNQGLAGAELSMNSWLSGTPGYVALEYDAAGRRLPAPRTKYVPPTPGESVVLTIDAGLERMAQSAADQAAADSGAQRAEVLLMDVQTGALLALAVSPTFDPSRFASYPASRWRDPAVSDTYPPGSTFKPITAAAALAAGVVTPSSGFFDPGFAVVNGRRIRCWKAGGHGPIDFRNVVVHSCNVGFVQTGLRLGTARFYRYLKAFGLTAPTGVDLPGEARPLLPKEESVKPVDLAVMAFGQTLTVTPLGLLTALDAIADGGELHTPQLVQEVISPSGKVVKRLDPAPVRRVVPTRVAMEVANMMEGVVRRGSGKRAAVRGYTVAGKTGTSQAVVDGRYAPGAYVASFAGFGPMPDPKVIGLVVVDRPQGAHYGGEVAAPVWGRLMTQAYRYLGYPPGSTAQWRAAQAQLIGAPEDTDDVPEVAGEPLAKAGAILTAAGLSVRVVGFGRAAGTLPGAGAAVRPGQTVTLFGKRAG